MRSKLFVHFALLSAFGWLSGACQTIAGIEERKLDPDAKAAGGPSPQCQEYCSTVMANCKDDFAVYAKPELCLAVCALLDPGDSNEPTEVPNSVACRAWQAGLAESEPEDHCKAAGPGGNGACGSDCEAYCQLFHQACKDKDLYPTQASCIKACGGLTEQQDRFNITKDHEGDTIECRLVHTTTATLDPATHCEHATIRPAQPWCSGKADAEPTCEQYCQIELVACSGDLEQYESPKQCLDVCHALDLGTNDDEAKNTVGCRRYHAFSATLDPLTHCYHAGPSGDGHCGDHGKVADGHTGNCESYCRLVKSACPDEAKALGNDDECMAACIELPEAAPDSKYTLSKAQASTGLQCRILHAAQAFEDPSACAAAVGGDPCQ